MRQPDFKSANNDIEAWRCPLEGGEPHGTVALFLLKSRKFHPFWDHWAIGLLHLRDIPGLPPAVKDNPDQTHEFMILALNPGENINNRTVYDADNLPQPLPWLKPVDVTVRFKCENDAKAQDICEQAVKLIVAGRASPDQDYRTFWKEVIAATVNCDKHPDRTTQ